MDQRKFLMRVNFQIQYDFFLALLLVYVIGCSDSSTPTKPKPHPDPDTAGTIDPPNNTGLPAKAKAIGINVNGQFDAMKFENVERTKTTWTRGFLDFFELYPNTDAINTSQKIDKFLKVKKKGYKTILNIKFNFHNKSFPGVGSQELRSQKDFLKDLLAKVWNSVDIIVVGNEPFIESRNNKRGRTLLNYYKAMAQVVYEYKLNRNSNTPIYMGAFNRLDIPSRRYDGVENMLNYIRNIDWLAGADLHIHHENSSQIKTYLDYVDGKLRDDQRFIITEFSLVWHWKAHSKDEISASFASSYNYGSDMKVYEYLDMALKQQVTKNEWDDFLSQSPWFEDYKHYLKNSCDMFKDYDKFNVATYALRQSYPSNKSFTASTPPWILNGLFANRTVKPDTETGKDQFNYAWIDDFKRIQDETK